VVAASIALGAWGEGVPTSPEAAAPRAVGETVPSAGLRAVTGEPADLAELVRDEGALLVFYRGGW
jgi:hypothetical protein